MITSGSFGWENSRWKGDMNDPEVTMSNAATSTNLIAHAKALDANGAETALFLFDEVRAMTWRLLNPKP